MGTVDSALYWLIIGIMLFFLGLASPGFMLFFFGLGALVTALVAWVFPIAISLQLAIFIAVSLVSLFALRGVIQRRFIDNGNDEEEGDADTVLAAPGDKGVVCMGIFPPAEGRIKYSGSFWRATADENIEDGEIIAVVRQDGLVIHVEKV